MASGSSFK